MSTTSGPLVSHDIYIYSRAHRYNTANYSKAVHRDDGTRTNRMSR